MKYLAFLFACFITILAQSQTWQRLIENPFNFERGSQSYGIRIIDDTIYVSSVFIVTDSISNYRAVISKHSLEDGQLLIANEFRDSNFQNSTFNEIYTGHNQLYDTEDTLFYMSITPYNDNSLPIIDSRLLVIDKNLVVVDEFSVEGFEDDLLQNFNGTRIDSDGNVLLYGSRSKLGYYFDSDSANTLLVKMTPQGEQLWKKRFYDSYTITFLEPLSDGDILINAGEVANNVSTKFIIKTNSDGVEQWRLEFGGVYTGPLSCFLENQQGEIITANSWNTSTNPGEEGFNWWQYKKIQLQRIQDFDSTYSIIQDKKYAPSNNVCDVFGIEEMTNNNILTWGTIVANEGADFADGLWSLPYERGFLFMCNENLDSLWFRSYVMLDDDPLQQYSKYLISDVATIDDGGFVTTGWGKIHDLGLMNEVWLMRLDEYGCLEPGCQNVNPTEIVVGYENSIQVYPNPVVDVCTLQWNAELASKVQSNFSESQIIIIDAMGREVQRQPVNNFGSQFQLQIDMSSFPSGLYQAHWVSGGSWLDSVQIIKQ